MKKRLLLVFAMVVALSLIATAAVSAKSPNHQKQPPSGVQVMVLNDNPDPAGDPMPGMYGCEEISWFGTIEIDGKTFGMALYSDYGEGFPIYEYGEFWKIFAGKFKTKDGVLKRCAPGRVLMAGYAEGSVEFGPPFPPVPPFYFESEGTVGYAAGYFKWWDGYDVYQNGWIGPGVSVAGLVDAFGFHGSFETN